MKLGTAVMKLGVAVIMKFSIADVMKLGVAVIMKISIADVMKLSTAVMKLGTN